MSKYALSETVPNTAALTASNREKFSNEDVIRKLIDMGNGFRDAMLKFVTEEEVGVLIQQKIEEKLSNAAAGHHAFSTEETTFAFNSPLSLLCVELRRIPTFTLDAAFDSKIDEAVRLLESVSSQNSQCSGFCTLFKSCLFQTKNNVHEETKPKCVALLNEIHAMVLTQPSFFFEGSLFHASTSLSLHNLMLDIQQLISNFVPSDKMKQESASYWQNLVKSYDSKIDTLFSRIIAVKFDLAKIVPSKFDKLPKYEDLEKQASALSPQQLGKILEELRRQCREWYQCHFTLEFFEASSTTKKSFELKEFYVDLKVLRESAINSAGIDNNLSDIGETVADSTNLQQFLDRKKLVLVEGAAGIGKTVFCKQFCVLQNITEAVAIFVPLKQLYGCNASINSIADLLVAIEAPIAVKEMLPEIIKYKLPIVWLLDGYDEVASTSDEIIKNFLHEFLDPITRRANLEKQRKFQLVRECDLVILTSRENRQDTSSVKLNDLEDPTTRPDLWIVQRWQRKSVAEFARKLREKLGLQTNKEDSVNLVDVALGPQMQGFHGIPLFVKLLCEIWFDGSSSSSSNIDRTKLSPPYLYQTTMTNALKRSSTRINHVLMSNSKELFDKYHSDTQHLQLFKEQVLPPACKLAYEEYLKNRAVVTFSIPPSNQLPLWIQVLREMGVILNDSSTNDFTRFKFCHRSFIEFLAASHVANHPETLSQVPFEDELDTLWLLICQMAKIPLGFFEQAFGNKQHVTFTSKLTVDQAATHVAITYVTLFKQLSEEYHQDNKDESEEELKVAASGTAKTHLKLLIQIAESLPDNIVMNQVFSRFRFWEKKPFLGWAIEWCGWFGAIKVLKWIQKEHAKVFTENRCRIGYCRALQRQAATTSAKQCIAFFLPYTKALRIEDALLAESHTALAEILIKQEGDVGPQQLFDSVMAFQPLEKMHERKSMIVTLLHYTKCDSFVHMCRLQNIAFNVLKLFSLVGEVADIWNPETQTVEPTRVQPILMPKLDRFLREILPEPDMLIGAICNAAVGLRSNPWVLAAILREIECTLPFSDLPSTVYFKLQLDDERWSNEMVDVRTFDSQRMSWEVDQTEFFPLVEKWFPLFSKCDLGAIEELSWIGFSQSISFEDYDLRHFHRLRSLRVLKLPLNENAVGITSYGFHRMFSALPLLEELHLSGESKATSIGKILRLLADLQSNLKTLLLSEAKVTNERLTHIAKMKSLEVLSLKKNHEINDFATLRTLKKLRELDVSGCNFTNSTVISLSQMESLETLRLGSNRMSDVTSLLSLGKLRSLSMEDCCCLTNESLVSIGKFALITYLDLSNNPQLDNFSPLYNLKQIETLKLDGIRCDIPAVLKLVNSLPNLSFLEFRGDKFKLQQGTTITCSNLLEFKVT